MTPHGPSRRYETNWRLVSDQLRGRPGEWARIAVGSHALAQFSRIVSGSARNWLPAGAFDATTRNVDGQIVLWAVYIGERLSM